jgi:hypothetical protein
MISFEKGQKFTGKVAFDLLHKAIKANEMQEVQETIDAMTPAYIAELEDCAKKNSRKYKGNFYIVCLRKKETFFINVIRQWFIARQTKPMACALFRDYPNYDHDIWQVSPEGDTTLLWSLPPGQEQQTIMKNPHLYHSDLVKWIQDFQNGFLE